jgi:hypothetical protein
MIIPAEAVFESDTASMRTPKSNRNMDVFLPNHCLSAVMFFTSFLLKFRSSDPAVNYFWGLAIQTPSGPLENTQLQRVPQSFVLRQDNPSQVGLKYGLFECLASRPNVTLRTHIVMRVADTSNTLIAKERSTYMSNVLIAEPQEFRGPLFCPVLLSTSPRPHLLD